MLSTAIAAGSTLVAADHWDGPGPWWPIFPILWLLIIGAVIFAVARRARHCGHGSRTGVSRLSERFAAGEIDETEYRKRLAVLKEGR